MPRREKPFAHVERAYRAELAKMSETYCPYTTSHQHVPYDPPDVCWYCGTKVNATDRVTAREE